MNSGPTTPRITSVPSFISASDFEELLAGTTNGLLAGRGCSNTAGRALTSRTRSDRPVRQDPTCMADDDDDWVGTPPEGRYTRDRAKPDFWWRQRPIVPAFVGIFVIVVIVLIVALLS